MSVVRVRTMTAGDLEAVSRLAGKLVRQHHAFDPQRFLSLANPEAGYARYFASELRSDDVVLVVAEGRADADGQPGQEAPTPPSVIGYAYARLEPRSYNELLDACAKLHDVYVEESARGRGAGEALVREVLTRMRDKGAPRVVLLTAVQNASAQRLFARLGFRATMLEMTCELDTGGATSRPSRT